MNVAQLLAEVEQAAGWQAGGDPYGVPVIYENGTTFVEIHEVEYKDGALYLRSLPKLSKSRVS